MSDEFEEMIAELVAEIMAGLDLRLRFEVWADEHPALEPE